MKKSFLAIWVFISLCFQSAVFAMPCCYGMASSAAESMMQTVMSSGSTEKRSSHCETEMASQNSADMGHSMGQEDHDTADHGCPMAGLAFSSSVSLFQNQASLPPQVGARIMQGKFSVLPLNQHHSRIDRPPRLV